MAASEEGGGCGVPRERRVGRASPAGDRPDLGAKARRLGGRGRTPLLAAAAVGEDDRARDGHERARRAAREGARHVRGPGSLRADPRAAAAPSAAAASCACATARGTVAPTTAPTLERPRSPTRSAPHSATSSATCCQTGRPSERVSSCTSARAGVRRAHEAEDPGAVQPAGLQEGLDRVAAEIGVDGQRVRERRPSPRAARGRRRRTRAQSSRCRRACRPRSRAARRRARSGTRARARRARRRRAPRRTRPAA